MSRSPGTLYLIPTPLGKTPRNNSLPDVVLEQVGRLDTFLVENIQTAVRFFQWMKHPIPDYKLRLYLLNKKTPAVDKNEYLSLLLKGDDVGLLSEAGCPAVADPGADMAKMAHARGIRVVPLVGPSSILLALMASGMNGQNFAFNGYLPVDKAGRRSAIQKLEQLSSSRRQTQIFMETPHRNNAVLRDLITGVNGNTLICVAASVTLPGERIITLRASDWKNEKLPDLSGVPVIFLIEAG